VTGPDAGAPTPGRLKVGEPLSARLQRLLAERVGLRLTGSDWEKVEQRLRTRAQRRFPTLAAYCTGLSDGELAREIERVAADLTPGETFFFRDHGHFHLLRFHILPELLQARRHRKSLRLWSAGCATGEEAYSLAMLVDMVLPDRHGWHVTIVGTDLNEEFLARAVRGRYGQWSFRLAPASLQSRYFHRKGDQWALNDDIRRMVAFRRGNLAADTLPDGVLRDMDLILCRNVLIYFQPDVIRAVAGKLASCLAPGGYLVTGHTELMGVPVPGLGGRLFPEGVVYQRQNRTGPAEFPPARPLAEPFPGPPAKLLNPLPADPHRIPDPGPTIEAAQTLANRGDYQAAEIACRKAIEAAPLLPAPHFLLAQLAQLRGDYRTAEDQLHRTLYLDSGCVAAYLELAALHERAGDNERALARRRAALDLLRRLPAATRVEPFGAPAGQLADWLTQTEAL
jgi:chemotaxis protein methyltransferase CheR